MTERTTASRLQDWLHHFEHRPQQEIRLGLERIRTVAQRLDLLQVDVPIVTVGGTNGKGSTVAALEAIYTAAGYNVGVYTSPHLLVFNERIRVNQQLISDASLCDIFSKIEIIRDGIHLTYFEMATLAALMHFKLQQVDVMILEVGLGGRLDATNIIDADVAIITTVDFDHEELLGNTLEAIGFEKAGILRPNKTLIYADLHMPKSIEQQASSLNVKTYTRGDAYDYALDRLCLTLNLPSQQTLKLPRPNLHPNAAAAAVVAVNYLCSELPVDELALQQAMQRVFIPGRMQVEYDTICTVFDVSHNPQAVRLLATRIKQIIDERSISKIHAVFSGLKDKDLSGLIQPMLSLVNVWYTAPLDNPRAAPINMIKEVFQDVAGIAPQMYGSIEDAYRCAKQQAQPGELLVIYGSFFVVSPIMLLDVKGDCVCDG
jgi:dihydrofolate synthase/folylpolyglutamate synthase